MPSFIFKKDSTQDIPRNIAYDEYVSSSYGTEFVYTIPNVSDISPIKIYHFSGSITGSAQYNILRSLKNTINYYSGNDELFNFDNFYNKPTTLYSFASAYLGSGLERGSVGINVYISGTLTASCSDFRQDGILYDQNDEKIGIILYREGFVLVNNTASIGTDVYNFSSSIGNFTDNMKWIHASVENELSVVTEMPHNTKNEVPTSTFFVYADKYKLNHSNNSTYLQSGSFDNYWCVDSEQFFEECKEIKVKNTVKSPFLSGSTNIEKQTFITRIGLHDENKNIIGYGSLATPVRKTENREFLFKLKIDL